MENQHEHEQQGQEGQGRQGEGEGVLTQAPPAYVPPPPEPLPTVDEIRALWGPALSGAPVKRVEFDKLMGRAPEHIGVLIGALDAALETIVALTDADAEDDDEGEDPA